MAPGMSENPKVSVCMMTYNHERFIAQAIESVLEQKTSFDLELVIGEDCSTDGTRKIVAEYARKYPEKIKAMFRETNLGMTANGIQTLRECRGRYIALLEGDDYWTDPLKLQKQVDFLDVHPTCTACAATVTKYTMRKVRTGIVMTATRHYSPMREKGRTLPLIFFSTTVSIG
jgi:glycosyltransferase involved in cell wall biosynthesis